MSTPAWPDFSMRRTESGGWIAATDTGRPVTPIFRATCGFGTGRLDEHEARQMMRIVLDDAYAQAHPDGCPGRRP